MERNLPECTDRFQWEPKRVTHAIACIADHVAALHRMGYIHRELKPSDIYVDEESRVRVTEPNFRRLDVENRFESPEYMSPEEANCEIATVDFRNDIYRIGAILYELLTGSTPFHGTSDQVIFQIIHEEPLAPRAINPQIPVDLETICLRAIAKEPVRRFQSAEDLRDDLLRFHRGEPIHSRRMSRLEIVVQRLRRKFRW